MIPQPSLIHAGRSVVISPDGSGRLPPDLWAEYALICLLEPDPARPLIQRLERFLGVTDAHRAALLGATEPTGGHGLTQLPDGELSERRALSLRPGDERLDWFLIRAATRQEAKAEASLIEAGFAVYLPRAVRWRRSGSLKRRVSYGLFGGYIFIGLGRNQCIGDATDIEGVHGAVRFSADTLPRPLKFAMIRAIAEQEVAGDYDRTRRGPRKDPDRGERVEIVGGAFRGFAAEFVGRREGDRVEVLLKMFGKLTLDAEKVGGMGDVE